jgi:hypothetical protein
MPNFVCGLLTDDSNTVKIAAPIMRWTIGKNISSVIYWVKNKSGNVERVNSNE